MTTLIRGGLVHDAVHRDACKADILLADGKIAAIGTDLTAPADAVVFDADGLDVFPGFVDAHTHIGLDAYIYFPNAPNSEVTATASGTRAATTTR